MNYLQAKIKLSDQQRSQQPLTQLQAMPQDNMQHTLKAHQNFTMSATGLNNISSMESNTSAPNATHYQSIQLTPPSTGYMIKSQSQRTPSANVSSATKHNADMQPRLMEHIRKRLEETIPESVFQHKPYVFSEDDFKMKMTAYFALNDREAPVDSIDDFPTDQETQRRLAREIVEAMLNRDKSTLIDPEARLPVARIKKLSPFELDLMAWKVLIETRDVQRGKVSLPSWGKDWPWEEFPSFSERFEAVKKALYHCKAMVSSLFDEIFAKRLPLNPTVEFSRKSSNKILNGKRKRDLELAKGVKRDGFVPSKLRQISRIESYVSTGCRSFGPQGQLPTASFANSCEQPQFGQSSTTDNFQSLAQNETGSDTNDSALAQKSTPNTGLLLGSPFSFQSQERRTGDFGDGDAVLQQPLPANNVNRWVEKSADSSNQKIEQAIGSNSGKGIFNTTQANPESNDQWTGLADLPSVTDTSSIDFFQGGLEMSDYNIAQNVQDAIRPYTMHTQQETISEPSILTDHHQARQKDLDTSLQQHFNQHLSDQDPTMREEDYLQSNHNNYLFSDEELEKLLNMPAYFDPELGAWNDEHGRDHGI